MLKSKFMPSIVLSIICVVTVLILAIVNTFTAPVIKNNEEIKTQNALLEVMPDGGSFTEIADISSLPEQVVGAYQSEDGGYVFKLSVKGFKTGLVIMCGIDSDGKITGSKTILSSETNGAEYDLDSMYVDKTSENYNDVDLIARSTLTSKGYRLAIEKAFDAYVILKGGKAE